MARYSHHNGLGATLRRFGSAITRRQAPVSIAPGATSEPPCRRVPALPEMLGEAAVVPVGPPANPWLIRTPSVFYVSGEADTPGHQYRIVRYMDAAVAHGCRVGWARPEDLHDSLDMIVRYDVLILWHVPWNEDVEVAIGAAGKSFSISTT